MNILSIYFISVFSFKSNKYNARQKIPILNIIIEDFISTLFKIFNTKTAIDIARATAFKIKFINSFVFEFK